jgi:hypothetical protein
MSGVLTSRLTVANLDQWGRLIKSWATHLDYISQDYPNQPPRTDWVNTTWPGEAGRTPGPATVLDTNPTTGTPSPWCLPPMTPVNVAQADGTNVAVNAVAMTADDFKARVLAAGVTISVMPVDYTNVVVVQGSQHIMVLRLPPMNTLQSSEDDLLNGLTYPLPAFYSELFGGPPTMPTDQPGIMKLHAYRIGEYTLNVCD